jgi:NTE family protein
MDGSVIRLNLALQGGGAHGAFTWGVLDRLLEEEGIEVAALSGTSAGALNAAAFKAGWVKDGRAGAKAALADLWAKVGTVGDLRMAEWLKPVLPFAAAWNRALESTFALSPMGIAAQVTSPYVWGSAWRNPLARVVKTLDMGAVCSSEGPRLYVGATNVRTGRIRVFSGAEISLRAILASACLPTVFQAVEIDDPKTQRREAYWDGGYTGNPPLFPLYDRGLPDDILIVAINPLVRDDVPDTAVEIQNRINEISFNSALMGELRAVHFVRRLIAAGQLSREDKKDVRLHLIADDRLMNELSASSKMLAEPALIERLRAAGHKAAHGFLKRHRDDLGNRPSLDLAALFG